MWIVTFGDNSRHSAWFSKQEALDQAKVLEQYGIIKTNRRNINGLQDFIKYDSTICCNNGYYYV